MRLNFHQSSKLADSATGALLEECIAPRPLMTFPTPHRYAVPAPVKEKDTPLVTLPSGSDEAAPSPRKCTDPAILYFSLQPDNGTAARQRLKVFEKRKVRRPVSVTSALRNAIPKALLLDFQHLDEIETFGAKADSKPANGVPATFEHFPDLPVELRLKIWNFALGGPRTVKIDFKISPRFVPGEHNARGTRSPKEIVIQHFVISSLTVEPLGTHAGPEVDVLDWLFSKSRQAQKETANFPPMDLLRVCQESRHEAIIRLPRYIQLPLTGERFYYHPEQETIIFDEEAYRAVFSRWVGFGSRNIKPILGHAKSAGIPRGKIFVGSWGVTEMYWYLELFRTHPSEPQFAWIKGPPKPPLRERLAPKALLGRVRAFFSSIRA